MRRLRWLCGTVLCGLLTIPILPGVVVGQAGDEKKSDPEPKKVEPKKLEIQSQEAAPGETPFVPRGFRMYLVADGRFEIKSEHNRLGKLHDPVTHYGLGTVIGVFVRGVPKDASAPAIALIKKEQEIVKKYRPQRVGGFVAFLALKKDFAADDDRDALSAQIATLAKGADVPQLSIGLAEATVAKEGDEKDGAAQTPPQVASWGIAPDDAITVVLYDRLKIQKRWKFPADRPPTNDDIKEISDAVDAFMTRYKR